MTPTKSRETFPVDFLLVATTNYADEEYICGAVRDRMVSLKIPLVGIEDEIRIVRKELNRAEPQISIPRLFIKLAVEVIRALRGDERLELGPRTSINAGLIARSSALLEGRAMADYCDVKEGIYTAILGKALYEDKHDVERKIDELFPDISSYLEQNIPQVELSEIIKEYRKKLGNDAAWSKDRAALILQDSKASPSWQRLQRYIVEQEHRGHEEMLEMISLYMSAFEKGCDK